MNLCFAVGEFCALAPWTKWKIIVFARNIIRLSLMRIEKDTIHNIILP